MNRVWPVLAAILLSLPSATANADSNTTARCDADHAPDYELTIPEGQSRLTIKMSRPPSSRVRLSLDRDDESVELEWDPNTPDRLHKSVLLRPGTWRVSFWAEPVLIVPSNVSHKGIQIEVNLNCFAADGDNPLKKASGHFFDVLGTVKGVAMPALTVSFKTGPTVARRSASALFSAQVQRTGQQRSFLGGAVPAGVEEAFTLLAEVALERAQSRGLALLTDKLRARMCDDLTWDALEKAMTASKAPRSGATGLAALDRREVLPQTCAAIASLRLHDLSSSGKTVMQALHDDLVGSILPYLIERTLIRLQIAGDNRAVINLSRKLTPIVADALSGNIPGREQALLIMAELAQQDWLQGLLPPASPAGGAPAASTREVVPGPLLAWSGDRALPRLNAPVAANATHSLATACGLDFAFRLVVYCARSPQQCSPGALMEMIKRPADSISLLGVPDTCKAAVATIEETWPEIDVFVNKAKNIVKPDQPMSDIEVLRATVDLFFDIILRFHCAGQARCNSESARVKQLVALRDTIFAILAGDVSTVLVKAGYVIEGYLATLCRENDGNCGKKREKAMLRLRRAIELIGAIAAYAATYNDDDKSAEAQAEAREARKQAIESLIDAATDRRGRNGDTIVSVGSSVGFHAVGGQLRYDAAGAFKERELVAGQVALPMGVAVQQFREDARIDGFHWQLSLIDLGQFLARSDDNQASNLTWADFVMVGGQVGLIFGSPSNPFVIGGEVRWSPTLFESVTDATTGTSKRGALRAGLFVSYYVPFFDLN